MESNKKDVKTNWTISTVNPTEALIGLVSCIEAGYEAWIEVRQNGDQEYPAQMKNPELNNPFNWTMSYGIPKNIKKIEEYKFFNDTEKDLTMNWINVFGDKEAVMEYQKTGKVIEGLLFGSSLSCPVRIDDANWYRANITKDNYRYGYWIDMWKPKQDIPYMVTDLSIKKVFTVCYTEPFEKIDKKSLLSKASEFLTEYANGL